VSNPELTSALPHSRLPDPLPLPLDEELPERLKQARGRLTLRRRGWMVRRLLLAADVLGLFLAFLGSELVFGLRASHDHVSISLEFAVFGASIPVWVVVAKLSGLYDHDDERAAHSTADEVVGVFNVVTAGLWFFWLLSWLTGVTSPSVPKLGLFWLLAIVLIGAGRTAARAVCRRSATYLQNTLIIGAGEIGQLVARKVLQHPEYGLNILGFVDAHPRARREDLGHLALLGTPEDLPEIVRLLDVERVVVAFSKESHKETLELVRSLRDLDVHVDIVPRLFEVFGPNVDVHTLEGIPLVGLPPVRLSRSSRYMKRAIDVIGATIALIFTAPLFLYAAVRIKLDSPGPIFFRQRRLGMNRREFIPLKFRTMYVGTDDVAHREFIRSTMSPQAPMRSNGLYKLERPDAVTPFGRWLRRTSLDELPQLINVLRGDMSLVGPRPCIPYETENFAPHHFERFLVPAGLTGLWQVTARARSTFGEALDMDVAYARGWSLGLDLRLLLKTPLEVLRQRQTA
jgi:exopolysaccharide biosynthesis polyprenyl glycosylphosphotransferase